MKITGTRTQLVELPADEPLAGAAENPNGKRPIVTVRVETDQGIEGVGVAYFGGALSRTLRHAIDELGALCVGEDPQRVEAVQQKLKNAAGTPHHSRRAKRGAARDRPAVQSNHHCSSVTAEILAR